MPQKLQKPELQKKNIKLKGKSRLRTKNREQAICIEQKNHKQEQLSADIDRLKKQNRKSNRIIGAIDNHWEQLQNDLCLIITDLDAKVTHTDSTSFFHLPTSLQDSTSSTESSGDQEDENLESLQAIQDRLSKSKQLMKKLSEIAGKIFTDNSSLWKRVAEKASLDQNLLKANTTMTEQIEKLRQEAQAKHSEIANLRKLLKQHEEQLVNNEQENEFLEDQNYEIATSYKRLLRQYLYKKEEEQKTQKPEEKSTKSGPTDEEVITAEFQNNEIKNLNLLVDKARKEVIKSKTENIELRSTVEARIKQYQAKDNEIRLLKTDKELSEDQLHQAKANFESNLNILQNTHRTKVEELESKLEDQIKQINKLTSEKSSLQTEVEKSNNERTQILLATLETRELEQAKTIDQLRAENEKMRSQIGDKDLNTKVSEMEEKLKLKNDEIKNLKASIQNSGQFAESMYKSEITRLKHKNLALEAQMQELKENTQAKKLYTLEKTMEILGGEVDRAAIQYSQLQKEKDDKIKELYDSLKELTEITTRLKRSNHTHALNLKRFQEEKIVLQQQIEVLRVIQTKSKNYVNSLKEQIKILSERNNALRNNVNTSQHASQVLRDNLVSLTQKYYYIKAEIENESRIKTRLIEEIEKKQRMVTILETHLRRKEERVNSQSSKLNQMKGLIKNGADVVMKKQLQMAKTRLLCSLCTTNRKSTIISKCYHMFCDPCIRNHFKSRNRKCPQCKHPFGQDDMKDIGFNFTL